MLSVSNQATVHTVVCCLCGTMGMSLIRTEPRAAHGLQCHGEFSTDYFCGDCFKLSIAVSVPVLQNLVRRL